MPLLIDSSSAARQLSDGEFRAWAANRPIFISSVMDELSAERRALADGLTERGMRPILFEDIGGRDEPAERAYLAGVSECDIYLGLIGERYGHMQVSGRSPTHEEYLKARELGRRISVWSREPCPERQGNARDFLDEVQVFHTTGRFTRPEDLLAGLLRRLGEIAADDEAPWVKLGDAVFRVEWIRDEGERVFLKAEVRDAAVARYLEGLRPDQWHRREDLLLTTSDRSGQIGVRAVASEMKSRSSRTLEIDGQVQWADGQPDPMAMGTSNYSAEDLAAIGLESGLLRRPLPEDLQGIGLDSLIDVRDPLQELMQHDLPEDAMGGIARLPIVERLVGRGQAGHVDAFELGPEHQGMRPLRLAYTNPQRYSNGEPRERVIKGRRPWQR